MKTKVKAQNIETVHQHGRRPSILLVHNTAPTENGDFKGFPNATLYRRISSHKGTVISYEEQFRLQKQTDKETILIVKNTAKKLENDVLKDMLSLAFEVTNSPKNCVFLFDENKKAMQSIPEKIKGTLSELNCAFG